MGEYEFLNQLLKTFQDASITGMVSLKPAALGLVAVLGILDITAMWGLYFGEMRVREIIGKVMKIGFFVLLINFWGPLTTSVEDTFVKVGQIASHEQVATKPSSIMVSGTKIMYRLWNNAIYDVPMADGAESADSHTPFYDSEGNLQKNHDKLVEEGKSTSANPFSGIGEAMAAIPGRIIKILLALAIFIAFAFIALNVLLCFVEFYLTTTLAIILLPFGVNSHTSFISQKALGATVNFGVKLMIMIFLLGLMTKMIGGMKVIANDDYGALFETVLQACMYAFLIWKLPSLISGMLSGTPSMGASMGGMIGGAAAAGSAAMGAGRTAAGLASGAGRAMANAARVSGGAFKAGMASYKNTGSFSRGAMGHLTGTAKLTAKHQINSAKNSVLNRVTPRQSTAAKMSNRLAAVRGYK